MPQNSGIPLRPFGRHDVKISALGFGGHHLGDASDESTATRLIHQAIDGGVNFFDNCWEYHRGKTEIWMGKALKDRRDRVFLMSKVCTHGRDKALADVGDPKSVYYLRKPFEMEQLTALLWKVYLDEPATMQDTVC